MDNQTKKCRYCHSEMDGNARVCPVCHREQQGGAKKMILLVALGLAVLLVLGSCMMNSGKKNDTTSKPAATSSAHTSSEKIYGLGESWTVDGQWTLRMDGATATDERNPYSDKTPAQVVILSYTYENLGYTNEIQDLMISDLALQVLDDGKAVGNSYPGSITTYAQPVPVGAACNGAQLCVGLDNPSSAITVHAEMYDSNGKKQRAVFNIPVE